MYKSFFYYLYNKLCIFLPKIIFVVFQISFKPFTHLYCFFTVYFFSSYYTIYIFKYLIITFIFFIQSYLTHPLILICFDSLQLRFLTPLGLSKVDLNM